MIVQGQFFGILELGDDLPRRWNREDILLLQMLAGQFGVLFRREELDQLNEHVRRSEKLSLAGQLMSAAARDLKRPLARIAGMSDPRASGTIQDLRTRLSALQELAEDAQTSLDRLVDLIRPTGAALSEVEIGGLLQPVLERAARAGLPAQVQIGEKPVSVVGALTQLQQVLTTLIQPDFVDEGHSVQVVLSRLAGKVNLVIVRQGEGLRLEPAEADLCQGLMEGFGGQLRVIGGSGAAYRFELMLPAYEEPVSRGAVASSLTPLTLLLIEGDGTKRGRWVRRLAERGHRVVPSHSPEEGLNLAQNLRFDEIAMMAAVTGGWLDALEQPYLRNTVFVLMSDTQDPQLASSIRAAGGLVSPKSLSDPELDQLLAQVAARRNPAPAPAI
jgi:hypothetical protein